MNRTPLLLVLGVVLGGCSASSAPSGSTLGGSIDQSSFREAVQEIKAVNSSGAVTTAAVDAAGKFAINLPKGATYHLFLSAAGKSMPLVLRAKSGHLQTSLVVKTGGASANMGAVRFVPAGTAATALAPLAHTVSTAAVTCTNGGDDKSESDGEADSKDTSNSGADCVDGIDATTMMPCDGGPQANANDGQADDGSGDEVDASEDKGVADLEVPDGLDCGSNDQSGSGDQSDSSDPSDQGQRDGEQKD